MSRLNSDAQLQEILYQALEAKIGLLLHCGEPSKVRQRLYKIRAKLQDVDLMKLQFISSPFPDGNLAIIKVEREESPSNNTTPRSLDELDL